MKNTSRSWVACDKHGFGSVLKIQYLLASAFTLSISPSRVTSLSIKLEKEKERKVILLKWLQNTVHAEFALRLETEAAAHSEIQQQWMTMQNLQ